MQLGLDGFSKHISDVQDYRQAYIDQVDSKVLPVLIDYGKKCKDTKKDLKKFETDRNKERKKIESRSKAKNTGQLAQTQNDLGRLTESVKRSTKLLEESILKFEEKRLDDLKHALMEYCRIEMTFAAKCLEQWSNCYQSMAKVNPSEDMIVFQQSLQPYKLTERLGVNTSAYGDARQPLSSQLQNTTLTQPHLVTSSATTIQSELQASATPVNQLNRTNTNNTNTVTQMSQNGTQQSDEESEVTDEASSEYETDTDDDSIQHEEIQTISRPTGTVKTGWS